MIAKPAPPMLTVEEYFALEAVENERRYEYIDGEIFDMTGGTNNHSAIKINVMGTLFSQLYDSDCTLRNSDMRVKISDSRYVYPGLSAVCGAPQLEDSNTTLINPVLVVEVTSPASLHYDRARKREFYDSVPSIQAYLVIDQHRVFIDLHTRTGPRWLWQEFSDLDAVIPIEILGCRLSLSEVYGGISFGTD